MQTKMQNTARADLMLIDLGKAEMPTSVATVLKSDICKYLCFVTVHVPISIIAFALHASS